jgi:hypothetical protein
MSIFFMYCIYCTCNWHSFTVYECTLHIILCTYCRCYIQYNVQRPLVITHIPSCMMITALHNTLQPPYFTNNNLRGGGGGAELVMYENCVFAILLSVLTSPFKQGGPPSLIFGLNHFLSRVIPSLFRYFELD